MDEATKQKIYRLLSDAVDALPDDEELEGRTRAYNGRVHELADKIEQAIDALGRC